MRLEKGKTRLKCKPCRKFYDDDGTVDKCSVCGGELKRITVWDLKPDNVKVVTKSTNIGG